MHTEIFAVMVAELIRYYEPSLVDLHNYPTANKFQQKLANWHVLNNKIFKKLGFDVIEDVMKNICYCRPWAIEQFLLILHDKLDKYMMLKSTGISEVDRKQSTGKVVANCCFC